MIQVTDPDNLTEKPPENLEEFAVFSVCVAGKTARTIQKCLTRFWDSMIQELHHSKKPGEAHEWWGRGPFAMLREFQARSIALRLKRAGVGCQTTKGRALHELAWADFDLSNVTTDELEMIHGIGPKTARFFLIYTRPGIKLACLDRHILRWMREQGVDAPEDTPSGRRYRVLEEKFLSMVPEGRTVAEFDLEIWKRYRR